MWSKVLAGNNIRCYTNVMKLSLEVLKDEKAPALALLAVVISKYGTECFEWSSEYLRKELESDYSITMSDLQSDKIQTAIVILTTEMFEDQYEVFETCTHLLNNQEDTFVDVTPLEAEELIAGLAHYRLIMEGHEERQFSDEVNVYAGFIFYEYGFCEPPGLFPTAIIPYKVNQADMTEKNAALQELFDSKTKQIRDYMGKMTLS